MLEGQVQLGSTMTDALAVPSTPGTATMMADRKEPATEADTVGLTGNSFPSSIMDALDAAVMAAAATVVAQKTFDWSS